MAIFYSVPNLAVVCIDEADETDASGRFYHYYSKEPVGFSVLGELIMKMDAFFDEIDFPQAGNKTRSFLKEPETIKKRKELSKMQSVDEMKERKGDIATFVIHVQYRQNSTWQGKIVWAEKNEEKSFRSALEMIKLMDGAVEEAADEKQKK